MIIKNLIPIDCIHFASGSPKDPTTKSMHSVINGYFGTSEPIKEGTGIYWKDGSITVVTNFNDQIQGTVKKPNGSGTFDVK